MRPIFKRPFAFWLPTFGLLFLLWSWADSCYQSTTTYFGYNGGNHSIGGSIGVRESRLAFNLSRTSGSRMVGRPRAASPFKSSTTRHVSGPDYHTWWFPLPDHSSQHESEPSKSIPGRRHEFSSHTFSIPHWCLIPAYLALWWAALRWHSRRVNKLRQTQLAQAA